jgi:threonine aldolase
LHEDHANARMLAETLAQCSDVDIDLEAVQTNIVVFSLRTRTASEVVAALKARGLLISTIAPYAVRLVTHHDADKAACEKAAFILRDELRSA